jgi:hypothetical protein
MHAFACMRLRACGTRVAGPRAPRATRAGAQNATTWLLPSELFPTAHRGSCHGAAAAAGKAGALLAGAWFGALPPARIFGLAAAANLCGAALTALFVPDVLGLALAEGDARWAALAHQPPRRYAVRARSERCSAADPAGQVPGATLVQSACSRSLSTSLARVGARAQRARQAGRRVRPPSGARGTAGPGGEPRQPVAV